MKKRLILMIRMKYLVYFVFALLFLAVSLQSIAVLEGDCVIKSSCTSNEAAIFSVTSDTNAHVALDPGYYNNNICCPGSDIGYECQGNYDYILRTSDVINSQVERGDYTNYANDSCFSQQYGSVNCVFANNSCPENHFCIVAISGDTNTHVESCEKGNYPIKVCCDTCIGSLSGNVRDEDDQPIDNALIELIWNSEVVGSAYTSPSGNYIIGNVSCNKYDIVASSPGFIPVTISGFELNFDNATIDFADDWALVSGSTCEDDCTHLDDNIIRASCDGINGCSFYDETSKDACDLAQPGWIRDYDSDRLVECAEGIPERNIGVKVVVACGKKNIIIQTKLVKYKGKLVKLHVATCR